MNYKFAQDAEFYFNLYEKERMDGALDKAAEYLIEAIRLSRDVSYRIELASLYSEMGQLDMSNAECFKVLTKDHRNNECLSILSSNYTEKNNYRAAYYYFSKFDTYGLEDLSDIVSLDSDINDLNRLGFKMVWSNGVKDCSDLKEEAEIFLSMKNYKDAIKTLNRIPKKSLQYLWAKKLLVYCHYMNQDYQSSLDITKDLMSSNQGDIATITVAYSILAETGEKALAEFYSNKIMDMKCEDIGDVLKAGYCLMDAKRFNDAVALLNRELINYPYNDNLLLLLSTAYYMEGNIDKAKKLLLKLINMYGDRTYARIYLESINEGDTPNTGIAYSIPSTRAMKYIALIDKKNESFDKFKKEFLYSAKFKSLLKWRIQADSTDGYSYMLISGIGFLRNSAAGKFLEELLLNEKISGEAKVIALDNLFNISNKKNVALVNDSYFRIVNLINGKETSQDFSEAYAMCCIYLSPMLKDYEDEIYKTFIKLNDRLKGKLNHMRSAEALAALILYHCDNLDISKEHSIVTGLFGATLPTFRKYLKILETK